jgi:hypothetical protein
MSPLALHVEGRNLVDSQGRIVRLPGVSAFALFKRFLQRDGWNALVLPILQEWRQVAHEGGYDGPIILRVFRHAGGANAFAMDPWSYTSEQIRDFAYRCGEQGFYIDWTGGDYQLCFSGLDGDRGVHEHHNRFCAALVGLNNNIWNVSNEPFKNGLDAFAALPPPWAPAVWYSGSWDDSRDTCCVNLHTDRNDEDGAPKWVGKAHESAPYMWKHGKPVFYDEPMGADEVDIPGRRSCVPRYFGVLGTVIATVSAVYFHSSDGMPCNGLRPITRRCAVQFFAGVAGGLKVAA